jgi:elongation factor G
VISQLTWLEKVKLATARLLIENAVAEDEAMLEKYLRGGRGRPQRRRNPPSYPCTATLSGNFYPVTGGDGRGVIVEKVLDHGHVTSCQAQKTEAAPGVTHPKSGDEIERKPEASQPLAGLAFKITTDPFVGKLAYFRVYSGSLTAGSYVHELV